jgi:hypothetical protein
MMPELSEIRPKINIVSWTWLKLLVQMSTIEYSKGGEKRPPATQGIATNGHLWSHAVVVQTYGTNQCKWKGKSFFNL